MPPSSDQPYKGFDAHCPICNTSVTATPIVKRSKLTEALEQDAEVQVVHASPLRGDGDHKWILTKEDKAMVRKLLAEGRL
jgi:hypothetical protein